MLTCSLFVLAGDSYTNYTIKDGLTSSKVYYVLEDSKGYLWFATENGLVQFDGKNFTSYTTAHGLASNDLVRLKTDGQNRLWILAVRGKLGYLDNDRKFKVHEIEGIENEVIQDIEFDGPFIYILVTSGIYIQQGEQVKKIETGSANGGHRLTRFGGKVYALCAASLYRLSGFEADLIFPNIPAQRGRWLRSKGTQKLQYSTINNLMTFDTVSGRTSRISYKDRLSPNSFINSYYEDEQRRLWIGTSSGLYGQQAGKADIKSILEQVFVTCIIQDREGNIWVTTEGNGVYYFPSLAFEIKHMPVKDQSQDIAVVELETDGAGNTWFGAKENRYGRIDTAGQIRLFDFYDGLLSERSEIKVIEASSKGVFFGSNKSRAGIYCTGADKRLKCKGSLRELYFDEGSQSLFMVTSTGAARIPVRDTTVWGSSAPFLMDDEQWDRYLLLDEPAYCVNGKGNDIWIGNNNGLYRVERSQVKKVPHPAVHKSIRSITPGPEGWIWLTTHGDGVIGFHPKKDKTITITKSDGLADNTCWNLQIDGRDIWVASHKGLSKIMFPDATYASFRVMTWQQEDGLVSDEINHVLSKEDQIILATPKGITRIPKQALQVNPQPPSLNITGIAVWGKAIAVQDTIQLKHHENNIRFEFIGIKYSSARDMKYKYRLNPTEPWDTIAENHINLVKIPPGGYQFEVYAIDKNGIVSTNPSGVFIRINSPFWGTTWFRIMVILFVCWVIYFAIRIRTQNINKQRKMLRQKVKEQTLELRKEKDLIEGINKELEKLSIVASQTDNGVRIVDREGKVLWINPGYERMTHLSLADLNEPTRINSPGYQMILEQSMKDKKSIMHKSKTTVKGGEELWVSSTYTPIFNKEGEVDKVIIIDTDITQLKQTEKSLIQANKDIQAFVHKASHDLKSPLASMLGLIDSARETEDVDRWKRYWDLLKSTGKTMETMLHELLELSKIQKTTPNLEAIDLARLIDKLLQSITFLPGREAVDVQVDLTLIKEMVTDRNLLFSILQNLISNSIKYRKLDTTESFANVKLETNGHQVQIRVTDNGIGMKAEEAEKAFEMFYRSGTQSTGTGLGLYIVKTAVEKLNGSISMKSIPGEGTTFFIQLPND